MFLISRNNEWLIGQPHGERSLLPFAAEPVQRRGELEFVDEAFVGEV